MTEQPIVLGGREVCALLIDGKLSVSIPLAEHSACPHLFGVRYWACETHTIYLIGTEQHESVENLPEDERPVRYYARIEYHHQARRREINIDRLTYRRLEAEFDKAEAEGIELPEWTAADLMPRWASRLAIEVASVRIEGEVWLIDFQVVQKSIAHGEWGGADQIKVSDPWTPEELAALDDGLAQLEADPKPVSDEQQRLQDPIGYSRRRYPDSYAGPHNHNVVDGQVTRKDRNA